MLLWKFLATEISNAHLDRNEGAARSWVHKYLPNLLVKVFVDDDPQRNKTSIEELFDWPKEWAEWQRNCRALLWLVNKREQPPKPKSRGDIFPPEIRQTIAEVLERTSIQWEIDRCLSESGEFKVALETRRDEVAQYPLGGPIDDLSVFWQAVFVSFFDPSLLPAAGVCQRCGVELPATKKTGKPSRSRYCPACNVKVWREQNPERARELDREQKRRERSSK